MKVAMNRLTVSFVIVTALGLVLASWSVVTARSHRLRGALLQSDPEDILKSPSLAGPAIAIGRKVFNRACASCHGDGHGVPAKGVPDLTDQDFLYGSGRVGEIEQIVLHGIRSGDPKGWHLASMPAYASPRPYTDEPIPPLSPVGMDDVTQYLLFLHGRATDKASAARGAKIYATNGGCWDCHERDGGGDSSVGAPSLVDDVWLYGDGSAASIKRSIAYGHAGSSPAFARTLSPSDARAVSVYVAALAQNRTKD